MNFQIYIKDVDSSHGRILILASLELSLMHNTSESSFSNLLLDPPVYLVKTEKPQFTFQPHNNTNIKTNILTSSNAKSPKLQPIYMFPNVNAVPICLSSVG